MIFGGKEKNYNATNKVTVYNSQSEKWQHPPVTGTIPEGKYGHTATVIK